MGNLKHLRSLTDFVRVAMITAALALSCDFKAFAQTSDPIQAGEDGYAFANGSPAYEIGKGPAIIVHRYVSPYVQRGAFVPFKTLAESDGFEVRWLDEPVSANVLKEARLLVVANAYTKGGANDYNNFSTLEAPSVYSAEEIDMIRNWVMDGGSLLILADHSPFAGGTIKLAEALGFTYMTGFAIGEQSLANFIKTHIDFRADDKKSEALIGSIAEHPITNGSTGRKPITHFFGFGGQAIIPPAEAQNILTIPNGVISLLTFRLQQDFNTAARIDSSGLSQGATLELGKGRVAVFGEAGGFTSQSIAGASPFGLSDPRADENADFVLATLRWLSGYEPR